MLPEIDAELMQASHLSQSSMYEHRHEKGEHFHNTHNAHNISFD